MSDEQTRKDAELWFEDGNVVVIAQQTAFRVHRGVLSRHSKTFGDVFTLPQSPDPGAIETMDGCPVVRIPDSSHDFKHLLHAMYDGASYRESEERWPISVLAALARLGHKYKLSQIFDLAMKRLKTDMYTDDYDTWRRHCTEIINILSGGETVKNVDHIEILNLLRQTNQLRLLPTAFVHCARMPIATLLEGTTRADGTSERLSPVDLEKCLEAKIRFTKMNADLVHWHVHLRPSASCTTRGHCRERLRGTDAFWDPLVSVAFLIARFLEKIDERDRAAGALCNPCADELVGRAQRLFKSQWNSLPTTFGIGDLVPDWPTVPV
ncbi:hypothetical protein C8Q76DRAFT_728758 [Earliella scabrosa]|nr:hypothetical protein C8Q76DRAFT_728758 [Earliella scabrosa]